MIDAGLFQHIDINKRRSVLLIIAAVVILSALGATIGLATAETPWGGFVLAAGIAAVLTFTAWSGGSAIVMAAAGGREVEPQEDRQLINVVEEMAIASGLPRPKVYLIDDPAMNAFATGMSPQDGAVAVTTGLRQRLSRDELQGVIAHEMAHVGNYDTRVMVLMAVLVGTVALLSDLFLRGMRVGGSRGRGRGQAIFVFVALILAIFAPIATMLIQFAVSRQREFLADATGAAMTRHPGALANALEKLAGVPERLARRNHGTQHLFIVNPFRTRQVRSSAFATHPPIAERIRRLRALEGKYHRPSE